MRKSFLKLAAALAIGVVPAVAHADNPSLASYTVLGTQFYGTGGQMFDVQFLFGRQGYNGSLFYQTAGVDGTNWNKILTTQGNFPGATINPAPGSTFGPLQVNGVGFQTVVFAVCAGNVATIAGCGPSVGPGPFYTSTSTTPSTNVRTLTGAEWNTLVDVSGVVDLTAANKTTRSTVWAFEDLDLPGDNDFNDVVFATDLQTVVPEPSTYALMAVGLLGLGFARRRRSVA